MLSTSKEPAAKEKDSTVKELFQWLIAILAAVAIALFVDNFLIVNAQIPSGSMENTIMTGDRVVGNRLSYLTKDPERYDVIIFKYPDDESQLFIKRIIGLPGETVEIRDGHIYIDGSSEPLEDVETKEYMVGNYGPYTVPEGCYFVMGDNRNDSKDSRYWINPYVSKDKILGKAVFRYWPINENDQIIFKGRSDSYELNLPLLFTSYNNLFSEITKSIRRSCSSTGISSTSSSSLQSAAFTQCVFSRYLS